MSFYFLSTPSCPQDHYGSAMSEDIHTFNLLSYTGWLSFRFRYYLLAKVTKENEIIQKRWCIFVPIIRIDFT